MPQLFKIQDIQSGPGENGAMNVYHLDNTSATSKTHFQVGSAFAEQMVDLVRLAQNANWEHVALLITELLTGVQALFNLVGYVGARGGDTTPASNSFSFSIKPAGPTIKRGGKRLVGVGENDTAADIATSTAVSILSAMTPGFYVPLLVDGLAMKLATVRPNGNPPTSYLVSPNQSAIYRSVGTQVTRKLGRGGTSTSLGFMPHYTYEKTAGSYAALSTDPDDWVDVADTILTPRIAAYTMEPEHLITL